MTEGIELHAIADTDEGALSRQGDEWNVPADRRYKNHQTMLEEESFDAVSIATPTPYHHQMTIDASRFRGVEAIWCEKPIAQSVNAGQEMVEACNDADIELLVNHRRRWSEDVQTLATLLSEERIIGDIRSVSATWPCELLRNASHLSDLLLYALDERPKKVGGHLTGSNEIQAKFDPPIDIDDSGGGGYMVTDRETFVTFDATLPRTDSPVSLEFVGTDGKITIDEANEEWRYWKLVDGNHVEQHNPSIPDGWNLSGCFSNAVENIVNILEGTGQNLSPGTEALAALKPLIGIYVSHYSGSDISFPLAEPLRHVTIRSW
jgi:predicted dehydrogenase